jgi:hypothetical protein
VKIENQKDPIDSQKTPNPREFSFLIFKTDPNKKEQLGLFGSSSVLLLLPVCRSSSDLLFFFFPSAVLLQIFCSSSSRLPFFFRSSVLLPVCRSSSVLLLLRLNGSVLPLAAHAAYGPSTLSLSLSRNLSQPESVSASSPFRLGFKPDPHANPPRPANPKPAGLQWKHAGCGLNFFKPAPRGSGFGYPRNPTQTDPCSPLGRESSPVERIWT